jgi:hypothetical protein
MVVLCLCLAVCGGDGANASASKENDKKTATERWNAYLSLHNESSALMEIFSIYDEVLGSALEPVITEDLKRFVDRVGTNSSFFSRINDTVTADVLKRAAASERTDLDKAAEAFAEGVRTTLALQKKAQQYYAAKSHVDDKLAKGKEMHDEIVAAYDELAASYDLFYDLMEMHSRLNALEDIEEMRKEGMKAHPAALGFMIIADNLASKLPEEGVVDPAALKPDYDAMVTALAVLQAVAADERQVKKEGLLVGKMGEVAQCAGKIKATMTGMMEYASNPGRPPRKPKRDETPEAFKEMLGRCTDAYNIMIGIHP